MLALEKDFIGLVCFDVLYLTWTRRLTMIGWAVATVGLNCVWDLDLTCFAIPQLAPVLSLCVRERMQLMNLRCRAVFWQPKAPTFVDDVRQ